MHELGVVFHIIEDLEDIARENQLEEISKVVLELGEVSTVIDSYLVDCWQWAVKKHELMKEAQLVIEKIPAVTYCEDCKGEYSTIEHGKICPYCKSEHTYLLQGNEFNIKEIEAC
ncbi:MAG: hydrogenase maturation nickel metallochaperone HypA [Eubacteriales bacterium]|nr:hydrogenase maturation nickel metallochaperone HypA [Eubacteriales bacterium]